MRKINAAVVFVCLVLCLTACSGSPSSVSVLTGDFDTPVLQTLKCESSRFISLVFSENVAGTSLEVGKAENIQIENALMCSLSEKIDAEYSKNNSKELEIRFSIPTQTGCTYIVRGTVTDTNNNSLTFASLFTGYNDNVPELILSEVQTKYSNPKAEFVEIYTKTGGNLSGVCIFSAKDGAQGRYTFPAVEVSAGEYIVVHFRNMEAGIVNETGTDLNLSGGAYSSSSRDLWLENTGTRIGDKTDVVLLEKTADGEVIDAVAFADSSLDDWPKEIYEESLKRAVKAGLWPGSSIKDAANGDKLSATRTISRQSFSSPADKDSWLVTATNTASPGMPNSDKI